MNLLYVALYSIIVCLAVAWICKRFFGSDHSYSPNSSSPDPQAPDPIKNSKKETYSVPEPDLPARKPRCSNDGLNSYTGRQKQGPHKSQASYLIGQQVDILRELVAINTGRNASEKIPQLETANFKELISHLVCGNPGLLYNLPGDDMLRKNRVIVVWMALVSKNFMSSGSHFLRLKSLRPSLKFKILHPGSARFVDNGLESFFSSIQTHESPPLEPENVKPPKTFYLLSKQELRDHGFPVPDSADVANYARVAAWPMKDPKVALKGKTDAPMFAIDCEMVETTKGSELARVSIVNESMKCIYDTFVKPDNPVTDYRTQYSGIDQENLELVTTSLSDVQRKLSELLPPNSILLGHSLDSDFIALKFIHPFVIDTSCLFTPNATPKCKPRLRKLAKKLLDLEIQKGSDGHDSIEDAATCMKLVKEKIHSGPMRNISFNEPNIFADYKAQGKVTGFVDKRSSVQLFGKDANYSCVIETDEECIARACEIIPLCNFTFLQLREMELFFYNSSTIHSTEQAVAKALDANIIRLVKKCPEGTLVFVVCGSGDLREVKRLQQDKTTNPAYLKKVVFAARTGLVIAIVV